MVTKTSLSAIRALIYITLTEEAGFLSPRRIAEQLHESPTYMAKVTRMLVRAGLLRVERGVKGGVRLSRRPEAITLQSIVETCQGSLLGDDCQPGCDPNAICAYHRASAELHAAISGVLSRWTLAELLQKPTPSTTGVAIPCVILDGLPPGVFHSHKDE